MRTAAPKGCCGWIERSLLHADRRARAGRVEAEALVGVTRARPLLEVDGGGAQVRVVDALAAVLVHDGERGRVARVGHHDREALRLGAVVRVLLELRAVGGGGRY